MSRRLSRLLASARPFERASKHDSSNGRCALTSLHEPGAADTKSVGEAPDDDWLVPSWSTEEPASEPEGSTEEPASEPEDSTEEPTSEPEGEEEEDASPTEPLDRFWLVASSFIALVCFALLRLVWRGDVGSTYQGDEGPRIFDAVQIAYGYPNTLFGGLRDTVSSTLFGVHPPGDTVFKTALLRVLKFFGFVPSPVGFLFGLSIVLGAGSHAIATSIARRSIGNGAGYLALFLFPASFIINDVRVSAMGEAIAMPLLMFAMLLAQRATQSGNRLSPFPIWPVGCLVCVVTFVRPEVVFALPGLCLAIWYLIGFRRAFIFGATAGAFEILKILATTVFSDGAGTSLTNVGARYFNDAHTPASLWRTDFVQFLTREPSRWVFVAGAVSVFVALTRGREVSEPAWRACVLLFGTAGGYLAVNFATQFLGLSPHASYRVNIVSSHLLVPIFAISFVLAWRVVQPAASAHFGATQSSQWALAIAVLIAGWGGYSFFDSQLERMESRVPLGVRASMDVVLERSGDESAVFIDRMRYWESGMLGYLAARDAPTCNYTRCEIATEAAQAHWATKRNDNPSFGTTSWAEYNTLRMHSFISEFRPQFIVIANEDLRADWERVGSGIWGEESPLWDSHIYPYLTEEVNYDQPQDQFLRLGLIENVDYFEDWVLLVVRSRNDVAIVYEAFYGRQPDA